VYAQDQVRISEEILALRERNAKLVALRYASGRESLGDKLQVEAQLEEAGTNVSAARRNLLTARTALAGRIGLTATGDGPVASGELAISDPPSSPPDVGVLLPELPAIQAARAQTRLSELSLSESRVRLWPTLSASYSRGRSGPNEFPDGPLSWSAGGSLSWPLFSSGVASLPFAWTAASRQLAQAKESARSTEAQETNGLQSAWASFAAAADTVRVQKAYLAAAEQRNREADIRYSSGLLSFENWEQIVTDFVNYKRSALRTRRDAVVAEAGWHEALGRGLEEP
jgi:outer membrane protein TolC